MGNFVLVGLVFVGVFTLYLAIVSMFERKQKVAALETKTGLRNKEDIAVGEEEVPELVGLDHDPQGFAAFCESAASALGVNVKERIKQTSSILAHAGIASLDAPYYLLFMQLFGRWLIALVGVVLLLSAQAIEEQLIAVLVIVLGMMGANLYLKNRSARRQKKLSRSFPDMLDLLVVCVESGLALDAALARVCRELGRAHPDVTKELNRARLELSLLNDRSQALQNLAERTNIVPFRSLVAALIQTEKFGTSLTDTLRVLSEDSRLARLMHAENVAGRLPALMAIPLICLLLPALILILLGPAFINISEAGGIFGNNR